MAPARWVTFLGVGLFWAGVLVAGVLAGDGYSAREDYISSLASRGSSVAALAITALLCSASAHLAASYALWTVRRARWCASCVAGGGVATIAIAAFRTSCPGGAAGCGVDDVPAGDWVDLVHGTSVVGYELFILGAMLALAVSALRGSRRSLPLALGSLAFAVASALLLGQTGGGDTGLWQRLWVADNLAWLLLAAVVATSRGVSGVRARAAPAATASR